MALVPDQKFSTFQNGGDLQVGDTIVGLRGGINTRFSYSGELPPGYVVPIDQGGTGATTAAGARTNLGLGTMAVQNANAVAITGGTALLDSGQVAASPVSGLDIANKDYVDAGAGGVVDTIVGTLNQINVNSTDPENPILSLSATLSVPGTFTIQSTIAVNAIINDDSMTTATATNLATALSIKNYIDANTGGIVDAVIGTANQIDVDSTDPELPVLTLSATLNAPGTFTIQGTTAVNAIINDNTLSTATATNLATALSIKNYIDAQVGGIVDTIVGTSNQIDVDSTDPENPVLSLSATLDVPGTFAIQGTVAIDSIINDSTMVAATATNIPTAVSIKNYVDNLDANSVKSVSGTANRITSTGGQNPVIDIASTYVGQASINTLGTVVTGTWQANLIGISYGGTGVSSVTTSPTANAWAGWDANSGLRANNFLAGTQLVTTSGGTTTLTVASPYQTIFSGSSAQTVALPVVATLVNGQSFKLINDSSNAIFVNSSGGNSVVIMQPFTQATVTFNGVSGTGAGSWDLQYTSNTIGVQSITGTVNQIIASSSTGNITLSLPQNIATTSSPTFSGLTLSNPLAAASGGTGITSLGTGVATALGQTVTGSGGMVLSTSPTITTPRIAQINDANGNPIQTFTPVASAVNYIQAGNQVTGSYPGWIAAGSDATIGLVLNVKNAAGGASVLIQGVAAANNALSGYVGEFVYAQVLFANATSISTTTYTNLTSIILPAGDWDVWGDAFIAGSGVLTASYCGISTTSAALPDFSLVSGMNCLAAAGVNQSGLNAPIQRLSLSGTTTVYLVTLSVFGSGTFSQSGYLAARRRR